MTRTFCSLAEELKQTNVANRPITIFTFWSSKGTKWNITEMFRDAMLLLVNACNDYQYLM